MQAQPTTTEPTPIVAKPEVFEIENAGCVKCDGPLWYDRVRVDLFCPACVRVPSPITCPTPTARKRK